MSQMRKFEEIKDDLKNGYILDGYIDENGKHYNIYERITHDLELTATYRAYCDDIGQDSLNIIEWTTKYAKSLIEKNPDYQYDGCSAAYSEGVAQFMPRNEACLDTSVDMPLINYAEYGYVSFYVTSAWVTAHIYIDDYYLGEVAGTSLALAKKFNISITGSNVYVNGNYAYRLTSAQNKGLKPISLRYVMDTYSKNADLCVSNFSTKVADYVTMAKSYAETLDNVVLGGFNTLKSLLNIVQSFVKYYSLCNEYEKTLVNATQKVLDIVNLIENSTYKVTYKIWDEVSSVETLFKEDILKNPSVNPDHKPFEFAYWGTEEGEFTGFNSTINEDLTLNAYYKYTSGVNGQTKYATKVYSLSYYCFKNLESYYGDGELVSAPSNPSLPTGYQFVRWTDNEDTLEPFEFGKSLTDDTTLFAVAKDSNNKEMIFKTIYHVTFKDGISVGQDKVVEVFEDECVNKIADPINGNNEFAYWAYKGKEFDFNTQINEDITLIPYYWQGASTITKYYYSVWEITKHMDDFAKANPLQSTGWVPNSGTGQYMAIPDGKCIEFGMRVSNKATYTLNIPKFNFSEYSCVSFDVKNTWTSASFKINGISIGGIGVNSIFKIVIKGNTLSVIVSGVENVLNANLSSAITTGNECLVLEAIDAANGNDAGGFQIYDFIAYRNPVAL